jgi:hypothetical protein
MFCCRVVGLVEDVGEKWEVDCKSFKVGVESSEG